MNSKRLLLALMFLRCHTVAQNMEVFLPDNPPGPINAQNVEVLFPDNPPGPITEQNLEVLLPDNLTCGCTTDTLPHPRIVLLGPTGVGKSTFGNRLFGITEHNGKEALCSKYGQERPYKFGVGHDPEAHTNETSWLVGHYLGDPTKPCITIIDSPGTGDPEGRDCEHGIALAKGIQEIGSIDAFLLLFNGEKPRFSKPLQEQIKFYTNIFGLDLFKNVITEFTYWAHDKRSVNKRKKNRGGLNETIQHEKWNKEYADRFAVPRKIKTVFIDPVYDEEYAETREKEKFEEYTEKLWKYVTTSFSEFKCEKRCKAPSGFFSGQPWLLAENTMQNATQNSRIGGRATITWQIWFAGCDGTGTRSYRIIHKTSSGNVTKIYEYTWDKDGKETLDNSSLLESTKVTDEPAEKYKTIRLTIDHIQENNFGAYFVENDKGKSQDTYLNRIIDGQWAQWGEFGNCSKKCIKGNEKHGNMTQVRECEPPQNGGLECKGLSTQSQACAHRHGETSEIFRQCPVDATWSHWPRQWSECSGNCIKEGGTVPQKTRSRVCQPERFGGKNCAELEDEANKENLLLYTETQDCTALPTCPKPASLGPWSEWSSCSSTCYVEGGIVPQSTRKRSCKKAELSTDDVLNSGISKCQDIGEVESYKNCEISACPVNAKWLPWGNWSDCTTSCEQGSSHRSRFYIPGRNGADLQPTGKLFQIEDCNKNEKCPVAAEWSWSSWSSCDIDCYRPDGYRGIATRQQSCVEGNPPHEYFNCDNPPAPGLVDTQVNCRSISMCSPLTRLFAWIPNISYAGTDASWVYLKLRNGHSGEECTTSDLDSPGYSWARGTTEFYTGSELAPCRNFYPSAYYDLQFKFEVSKSVWALGLGSDTLKISKVELHFGRKVYTWYGSYNSDSDVWNTIT